MSGRPLVILCAGSGAVAMASRDCAAPFRLMGGKGRIAKPILHHMEIVDRPERIVLIDPGACGRAWQGLITHQRAIARRLRVHARHRDHGALWKQIAERPVPTDLREFTIAFLVLQQITWRSKPIGTLDDRWVHDGLDRTMAYGIAGTDRFGAVRPQLLCLPDLVADLDLRGVEAHQMRAEDFEPIPDADTYCDPPYLETQPYHDDLPRSAVLELRDRHVAAGCRFAISEAKPIPGMRSVLVGRQGKSQGLRDSGPRREEWLSLSFEAAQLEMGLGVYIREFGDQS